MVSTKAIVCPLSWGLGHAARCIPIVEALLENRVEVVIAGNGASGKLLQNHFPELIFVQTPFHEIRLHKFIPAWLSIIMQLPLLIGDFFKERRFAQKIIKEHHIDIIISDNRYGLRSSMVTSILVTHQLHIMLPLFLKPFEPLVALLVRALTSPFSQTWVPDFPGELNLSGALSHGWLVAGKNVVYVGPLSRFKAQLPPPTKIPEKVVAIISGPDPRRTAIQQKLISEAEKEGIELNLIGGKPQCSQVEVIGSTTLFPHLPDDKIHSELLSADLVIANAGYSTIMDLWALGCSAILIPFPGQTEQSYLARYHKKRGNHLEMQAKRICLKRGMDQLIQVQPKEPIVACHQGIQEAITPFLKKQEERKHGYKTN